jgi:uncharacterized protein (DUF983 family)
MNIFIIHIIGIGQGGVIMGEFALTGATWFWLLVPMPLLIVLSIVSYRKEGGE